jgi:hypothetical protein
MTRVMGFLFAALKGRSSTKNRTNPCPTAGGGCATRSLKPRRLARSETTWNKRVRVKRGKNTMFPRGGFVKMAGF